MAELARSNDQPLSASNTELSIIDDEPIDVHTEPEDGWQVIMHDENEGKMVIVKPQTKELDIYVSVTRSRWAGQMRNKPLAAPSSESKSDSDMCPVCHQTVASTAHDHAPSDELALAVPQTEDQVYVDRDYFVALNSVSEAAPSPPPTAEPVPEPSRLAHLMNGGYYRRFFQEDKRLGSGGYGAVYLVRHQIRGVDLGHYALKKVPCGEDEEWLVRVLREVTVLQALTKHPHLVNYKHAWLELDQIADFGPQVPCLFILMEYANSGNLYDYVVRSQVQLSVAELRLRKRRGDLLAAVALTHDLVWSFFLDVLLGLDCMHACDMIHHDLKPQNILLHATTNNGNVRGGTEQTPVITCLISDFGTSEALKGIAVASEQDSEQRNNHLGTLEWLAPEVVRETINSNSDASDQQVRMSGDIWSLGMILYFMLCKRLPYQNSTLDQILDMEALKREISEFKHVTYPADCKVPEDLKALVELMLRPNPRDRPTTQQLLSHVTVVQKLAALHRTMSYHESIVQHNVREVSTTQLSRDPPPRDQSRDQLALSSDSISLSDSTSSLPRLITPPMTRRASDINARPTPQTPTAATAKNSAPKKDPGSTKFSNRFSRQNARASSYFKPNSFTNGIPSSGIPRSPRASNNIPSSFMASPPPSLGSTPLPSYDDLFEYFKTNKMAPNLAPTSAVNTSVKVTPVNSSLAPMWKQVANLMLFLLRLAQSTLGCTALASPATSHQVVFIVLAAVTLLLSVHKRTKIPQIVITGLLWLWTGGYYLTGHYCTPLLADLAAGPLTAPSSAVLLYATVCYALALVLLFADQQIERVMGWSTEPESKEHKAQANGEVDWNAVRQQLQQLKKRR